MRRFASHALIVAAAGALLATPVAAQPPWAKGKGNSEAREPRGVPERVVGRPAGNAGLRFEDRQRTVIREYYVREYQRGFCPPGLAKKNNGCMPPGQAKKWRMGRPLPADIVIYDLPPPLVVRIGIPPEGYKYVRAGADILMIAVGTKIVVDAVRDLGRL